MLLSEAVALALLGGVLGAAASVAYGWLVIAALRTIWIGAVGTNALTLHVAPSSIAAGAAGGVLAAIGSSWWAMRGLHRVSERRLLAGELGTPRRSAGAGRGCGARGCGPCGGSLSPARCNRRRAGVSRGKVPAARCRSVRGVRALSRPVAARLFTAAGSPCRRWLKRQTSTRPQRPATG
jgi:hypothetical protein